MQPAPFVIDRQPDGVIVASDGTLQVIALDAAATMFLRRGISGLQAGPVAEKVLPQLNALAGDLLARSDMPASELRARLHILAAACDVVEPKNTECCVAEIDGVRAYVQQGRVILTRQDIQV